MRLLRMLTVFIFCSMFCLSTGMIHFAHATDDEDLAKELKATHGCNGGINGPAAQKIWTGQWWTGGTLARATYGEWKKADLRNKIATCAGWAMSVPAIEVKVLRSETKDTLKPYAWDLYCCMEKKVSLHKGSDDSPIRYDYSLCINVLGWEDLTY